MPKRQSSLDNGHWGTPGKYQVRVMRFALDAIIEIDGPFLVLRTRLLANPDSVIMEVLMPVKEKENDTTTTG